MRVQRPEDGAIFEGTPDQVHAAVKAGAKVLDGGRVYNPETKQVFEGSPEQVMSALQGGALLEGSQQHKQASIGKLESFGRGAVQGGLFGFGDEIAGGVESIAGSLGLTDVDKTYTQARDESRANFAAAEEANPVSSMAGNIAGGIGTALIPTGGVLSMAATAGKTGLAGSKVAQAGILGAKLGGLSGLGNSGAEDAGGVLRDGLEGAALGGTLGGATQAAAPVLMGGLKAGREALNHTFGPVVQRLEAMGAKVGAVKKLGGYKALEPAVEEFTAAGGFNKVNGHYPNPEQMQTTADSLIDGTVAKMHGLVEGQSYPAVDSLTVLDKFQLPLHISVESGDALQRDLGNQILKGFMTEIEETGGSLPRLWELKKDIGKRVSWVNRKLNQDPPIKVEMTKEANRLLGDIIESHTADIAEKLGVQGLPELNRSYSNMSKISSLLDDTIEEQALKGGPGNPKMSDYVKAAAIGGGVGSMLGVPGLGGMAGAAALGVGAAARSTSGRLARAKIGETIGLGKIGKATKDAAGQQAAAQGLIPRTLVGAREWLTRNAQMVPPEVQQTVKDILTLPDAAAELQVRALMPLFDAFVEPSMYKSEFNGKITSPQDRVTARQIIAAQGLPPSTASFHMSMLHKSGKLQDYHYAKPAEDYGDELLNFNERLTQMGY